MFTTTTTKKTVMMTDNRQILITLTFALGELIKALTSSYIQA